MTEKYNSIMASVIPCSILVFVQKIVFFFWVSLSMCVENASIPATNTNGSGNVNATDSYENWLTWREYKFIYNTPDVCQGTPLMVVFVTSRYNNYDNRQAIRETWGSRELQKKHNILVLFMLGKPPGGATDTLDDMKKEHAKYKDTIVYDIEDNYRTLTHKSVAILRWITKYCEQAKYLLKTDDDMFIHTEKLVENLQTIIHTNFIMGDVIAGASPMRDKTSKYYTPFSMYKDSTYPKYVSGTAYVISGDLITKLYHVTQENEFFWIEDIFITGICAPKAGARLIFNGKFEFRPRDFDPCVYKDVITGHELTPSQLRTMWVKVHDPHLDCSLPPIDI